ncbi:hypothetical protein MMC13_001593 [Lambiella insularis]|nr:hypothetical protein [Lambiella insularis]
MPLAGFHEASKRHAAHFLFSPPTGHSALDNAPLSTKAATSPPTNIMGLNGIGLLGGSYREHTYDLYTSVRRRPVYLISAFCLILVVLGLRQAYASNGNAGHTLPLPVAGGEASKAWDYQRDGKRLVMGQGQCESAFPGLFQEVDRMVGKRQRDKITSEELDRVDRRNGYFRVMLYEQELYVIATEGCIYSRCFAVLQAIHRAVVSSPEPLPNIEFIISTDDKLPPEPIWSFAREKTDEKTWLMPDFGFWSWPETKVGSYSEVQRKAIAMEDTSNNPTGKAWSWKDKHDQLFWRGALMGLEIREQFINITAEKPWADVKALDWHKKETIKSMDEHCQYKYLAQTEGNSYSGRLKYLLNCRSVIVAHEMSWIQHFTPLMVSAWHEQNFVEVKHNFEDLEERIEDLQKDDKLAEKIANNSVKTFRERYLTPAANVCYWRYLIKGYASVSFAPSRWTNTGGNFTLRGLPVEDYLLERRLDWDPY